jgi:ribosome modulation factor
MRFACPDVFAGSQSNLAQVPLDGLWFFPGDALVQTRGYYTMKRQKRDRNQRAFLHGYKAGIGGRSRDECPSQEVNLRENWMSGWREGRGDQWAGMTGVSGIHKNPAVMT